MSTLGSVDLFMLRTSHSELINVFHDIGHIDIFFDAFKAKFIVHCFPVNVTNSRKIVVVAMKSIFYLLKFLPFEFLFNFSSEYLRL